MRNNRCRSITRRLFEILPARVRAAWLYRFPAPAQPPPIYATCWSCGAPPNESCGVRNRLRTAALLLLAVLPLLLGLRGDCGGPEKGVVIRVPETLLIEEEFTRPFCAGSVNLYYAGAFEPVIFSRAAAGAAPMFPPATIGRRGRWRVLTASSLVANGLVLGAVLPAGNDYPAVRWDAFVPQVPDLQSGRLVLSQIYAVLGDGRLPLASAYHAGWITCWRGGEAMPARECSRYTVYAEWRLIDGQSARCSVVI